MLVLYIISVMTLYCKNVAWIVGCQRPCWKYVMAGYVAEGKVKKDIVDCVCHGVYNMHVGWRYLWSASLYSIYYVTLINVYPGLIEYFSAIKKIILKSIFRTVHRD